MHFWCVEVQLMLNVSHSVWGWLDCLLDWLGTSQMMVSYVIEFGSFIWKQLVSPIIYPHIYFVFQIITSYVPGLVLSQFQYNWASWTSLSLRCTTLIEMSFSMKAVDTLARLSKEHQLFFTSVPIASLHAASVLIIRKFASNHFRFSCLDDISRRDWTLFFLGWETYKNNISGAQSPWSQEVW